MSRTILPRLRTGFESLTVQPARWPRPLSTLPVWQSHGQAIAAGVFILALLVRLPRSDQPLLENFIDRQIHTAMIARNLARGGPLLLPQIDIAPFPAYYMLEFPGYPMLVAILSNASGAELDTTGRAVSAVALGIAAVLLLDLVRRRDGKYVAGLAGLFFILMPVTVRYGRAFQPDALMLCLLVAGVWAMDRWAERGRGLYLAVAALVTGGALLLKVIAAYVLIPLAYLAWTRHGRMAVRQIGLWAALAVIVLPSALWYFHAWHVAAGSSSISTPFWGAHKWVALDRLLAPGTYRQLAFYVGLRVLTPIGASLLLLGALVRVQGARGLIFHVWLGSLATYFPILVRKLDHEHYYLALSPLAAVFIARALSALASAPLAARLYLDGRVAAGALAVGLAACNLLACASTFRIPEEWRHVSAAAADVRAATPPDALVVAHSSVLFYADRRGFAMAYRPHEVQYLFGTWEKPESGTDPSALLEFYRRQGAQYFVELLGTDTERENAEFMEHVRSNYRIVKDSPGKYLLVALRDREHD